MQRDSRWSPQSVPIDVPGRAYIISKMTQEQINALHILEVRLGRPMMGKEILSKFLVEVESFDEIYREALRSYAIEHFPDAIDPEPPPEAAGSQDQPWYKTHAHLALQLGCYHAFDWKCFHSGIPQPRSGKRERVTDRIERSRHDLD